MALEISHGKPLPICKMTKEFMDWADLNISDRECGLRFLKDRNGVFVRFADEEVEMQYTGFVAGWNAAN